jgi:RimJ/RimL family protein N-acetyltransferase
MLAVKKVDENSKQHMIDCLKSDVIRHVFAFYDLQYEPQNTTVYATFENENLKGYILIYTALEFPSVILECDEDAAGKLIEYAPENQFIVHTPPNLLPAIMKRFPDAKHYMENWMQVKKGQAKFFRSIVVCRLRTVEDASKLANLLSTRKDRLAETVSRYVNLVSKTPTYGVFINNELVAYAGSFCQLPQVWMIGGVFTHPDCRNRGYATLAVSAVTEEALKNAESAALFVRSDNYPAIRAYEKIGYKKIGEKLWVDVGAGRSP